MRALFIIVVLSCGGCVTLHNDAPHVPYPDTWPRRAQVGACSDFTGTYKYFGSVYPSDQSHSAEIIEPFFEHRKGPGTFPETASIIVNAGHAVMLTLKGAIPEQMTTEAECSEGRLVVKKTKQSSSDGTPYELRQQSELWQGPQGELITYMSWGMRSGLSCCVGETPIKEHRWIMFERVE